MRVLYVLHGATLPQYGRLYVGWTPVAASVLYAMHMMHVGAQRIGICNDVIDTVSWQSGGPHNMPWLKLRFRKYQSIYFRNLQRSYFHSDFIPFFGSLPYLTKLSTGVFDTFFQRRLEICDGRFKFWKKNIQRRLEICDGRFKFWKKKTFFSRQDDFDQK